MNSFSCIRCLFDMRELRAGVLLRDGKNKIENKKQVIRVDGIWSYKNRVVGNNSCS